VLLGVAGAKGITSELIPRIATGFCGGIARTRGMCGALTGAIMAINMCSGRNAAADSREENYVMVSKLVRDFERAFGTTNCYDLTGCNFTTAEGRRRFLDDDIFGRCRNFTEEAARMAMTILEENEY
jgi:C_GCAxxG_C_C family probable redox protein